MKISSVPSLQSSTRSPGTRSTWSGVAATRTPRAAEIAADHGGEVVDYGNGEWVVNSRSGDEIARWEIA